MRGGAICFFLNLFVCVYATAQKIFTALPSARQEMNYDTTKRVLSVSIPFNSRLNLNSFSNPAVKPVSATYYFNSLGFFCQKELQIEKTLKFPVKFRLGGVAYTDQMEGKGKGSSLKGVWK